MCNHSAAIKIRHTASAEERLKQAHTLMGMTRTMGEEMEVLFNHWAKVRISDAAVKKLIQIAMAPNQEALENLAAGKLELVSARFTNTVDQVYAYALGSESQQMETTAGTVFGAYNAVTGYFQNVRTFKSDEAKFKSIMDGTARQRTQVAFDLCKDFVMHSNAALINN